MRRLEVRFRPEARRDLRRIAGYLHENGASVAAVRRFLARIEARSRKIGEVPLGGRPREDLLPGLRSVPFERSAVILYEVNEDHVRILNIFYGGRDYEALYHEPDPPAG